MPAQKTFTILPDIRAAAVNNAPVRPMTSKQVKKAHKAANKQPKLSRAEQRRLELAEQERIRKEDERERAAAKARAARERKKAKELAQKELKKKAGRPLVDVRPSQDTISRFVRGNGSGKKRDERGTEVASPMPAVEEETEPVPKKELGPNSEPEVELAPENALELGIEKETEPEQALDQEADREPEQDPGRDPDHELNQGVDHELNQEPDHEPDQGVDIEINQELDHELDQELGRELDKEPEQDSEQHLEQELEKEPEQVPEKEPGRELYQDLSQELDQELEQVLDRGPELRQDPRLQPDPRLEDLLEDVEDEEDMWTEPTKTVPVLNTTMDNAMEEPEQMQTFLATCPENDGELQELLREETTECVQPIHSENHKYPPVDGRPGSFCIGSDEMIDDESLIELTEILENEPDMVERKTPTAELELKPLDPEPGLPILPNTDQDEDKDYGSVHISTEEELDLFRETETRKPKVAIAPMANSRIPEPRRSQHRPFTRQVSSFFLENSLDDDLLLQLELPGETKFCQQRDRTPRRLSLEPRPAPEVSAVVKEDFDDTPTPSPVSRRALPLSTQAIMLNLDDYLPSGTQVAFELEDDGRDKEEDTVLPTEFQETSPPRELVIFPLEEEAPSNSPVQCRHSHASPRKKRFFTPSGSNEAFQLAKHLSRRSAALEGIHRHDRLRVEPRVLTSRDNAQQSSPSQRRATSPSCFAKRDRPVHNVSWAKPTPKTVPVAAETASAQTKKGNINTPIQPEPSPKRLPDKENIRPGETANDLSCRNLPPASQETEYGGAWIDDVGLDLMC